MVLRKAANPGRRCLARVLTAVATGILQLHLFFVMELHHHSGEPSSLSNHTVQTGFQASPGADQPCPACQMARQGSISSAGHVLSPVRLNEVGNLPLEFPGKISNHSKERPYGRAPPLS